MSVNLKAPVFLSQYVARGMVERGDGGAIVNVSSVASSVALTDHLAYCENSKYSVGLVKVCSSPPIILIS
ncbi:L-xylulose reductase [Geodia barretti]|uniref:L-xylulose reductase n=1 Tax=Geodia barretti TaxID=519541 RepID=A0AA35TTI5_GEOBA|nr:L-xylulose reductase [Geodia barretti]